ncbi:hypothetical protein EK904_007827 [Melospiza melodia maxima]|nr:hypothetical protein EK904_007827 [Melospiza melodia maxima]
MNKKINSSMDLKAETIAPHEIYKVTATGKQSLPKQALWLRMKAEQSNENFNIGNTNKESTQGKLIHSDLKVTCHD